MENSKKILITAGIVLLLIIGIFLYKTTNDNLNSDDPALNSNLTINPTPTAQVSPSPQPISVGKLYADTQNNFSFNYPEEIFKPQAIKVSLPFGSREQVTPLAFKHEINTEYCALSGKCQPTTIDMSFGAVVLPQSLESIKKIIQILL